MTRCRVWPLLTKSVHPVTLNHPTWSGKDDEVRMKPVPESPTLGISSQCEGSRQNNSSIPFLSRFGGFIAVCIQLILVLSVVRLFDIAERNHFFVVCCIAVAGFAIHFWLPVKIRAAFFCILSIGTILFVLGVLGSGCVASALAGWRVELGAAGTLRRLPARDHRFRLLLVGPESS